MSQGSRPTRVGDQIRAEMGELLTRDLRDPGLGFVTITRVRVTPDLQLARIYYTVMGDAGTRRDTRRALARAEPFIRRRIGGRLRLRRVPALEFHFDESIEGQERVERLLQDIHAEHAERREHDEQLRHGGQAPGDESDATDGAPESSGGNGDVD